MKSKISMLTAMMAAFGAGHIPKTSSAEKQWKPTFSKKELELVRSLPKAERQKLVRELRAKYVKERV